MTGPTASLKHKDIDRVLLDEGFLARRCADLGAQIADEYRDKNPLFVITLAGAYMFAADLMRCAQPEPAGTDIDFIRASSYGADTKSSGKVSIDAHSNISWAGRNVILVEDIVDTGYTLQALFEHAEQQGVASVAAVALLDKRERREVSVPIKHVGSEISDLFVVGYGMDYAGRYRTLPYVGVLRSELYT